MDGVEVHGRQWIVEPARRATSNSKRKNDRHDDRTNYGSRRHAGQRPIRGDYRISVCCHF